jgi:hypothetical protein
MHYAGVANCWVLQLTIHLFQNTGSEDHLKVKSKLTHYDTSVYCAPLTLIPGMSQIRSSLYRTKLFTAQCNEVCH